MKNLLAPTALAAAAALVLSGCGGDSCWDCVGPGNGVTSYVGSTDVIAAWADPGTQTLDVAPTGQYAGKRQFIRGTVSPYTGDDLGQPAGVEIYEWNDGTIHLLDLTDVGYPNAVQVSSETQATLDPACTTNGTTAWAGAPTDYTGVFFAPDLAMPTNSTYVYRLPGADGICGTADDVTHAVRTGMSATDAPLTAAAMPAATVYTSAGSISGYVARSGSDVVLLDANLANPTTLASFVNPISVMEPLPTGQTTGYETGRLFLIDGDVYFVDYAGHTVSASLFTVPGWTATDTGLAAAAASPDTLYLATYSSTTGATQIWQMPANGSAAATLMATVNGRVTQMEFPVGGTNLVVGVAGSSYSILALPAAGGLSQTVLLGDGNGGRFTATATDVYWTQWTSTTSGSTTTRTNEHSGINTQAGAVVMASVPNSMFMIGGEAAPWTNGDLQTQRTPLVAVFQVTGLTSSSSATAPDGRTYTAPILTGATIQSISTSTHSVIATVGTFGSTTSATMLDGVVHPTIDHWIFIDAENQASSQDPATHDVYLVNSQVNDSLVRGSFNL